MGAMCSSSAAIAIGSSTNDDYSSPSGLSPFGEDPLAEQARIASVNLYDASENADFLEIKRLFAQDEPDVNFCNEDKHRTALHASVIGLGLTEVEEDDGTTDRPAIVTFLIKHGADVDAEDDDGRTPFQLAYARRLESPSLVDKFAELGHARWTDEERDTWEASSRG